MSFQVVSRNFPGRGQFYPDTSLRPADFGIFVKLNGTLYAPDFSKYDRKGGTGFIGGKTPWTCIYQSGSTGTGTVSDPWRVDTTKVTAGTTGLEAVLRTTYCNTDDFFRHDLKFTNTHIAQHDTLIFDVFLGSDIYLANSDSGIPFMRGNRVGGKDLQSVNYKIMHIPVTTPSHYIAAHFQTVWMQIGAGRLGDSVEITTTPIDNGAALQWSHFTLPPGESVEIQSLTCFGNCSIDSISDTGFTGVNKDLQNGTGQDANGVEILLRGSYPTIVETFDGYYNHFFFTFTSTILPDGNTKLHWSNPRDGIPIQPDSIIHVGFLVNGQNVSILGVFWLWNGIATGAAHQVNVTPYKWSTGRVLFENSCTLGEYRKLYIRKIKVEWHRNRVPLADLNPTASRTPIRIDIIPPSLVIPITPQQQVPIAIPTPPADAKYQVIIFEVASDSTTPDNDITYDFVEYPLDPSPPHSPTPASSLWNLIAIVMLLTFAGYGLFRLRGTNH